MDFFGYEKRYATLIGGRIPAGWTYYSDSNGVHFTPKTGVTARGRYVSLWKGQDVCTTITGQLKAPANPSSPSDERAFSTFALQPFTPLPPLITPIPKKPSSESKKKKKEIKRCAGYQILQKCAEAQCHAGIASMKQSFVPSDDPIIETPIDEETGGGIINATNCGKKGYKLEVCLGYFCCDHECDQAVFRAYAKCNPIKKLDGGYEIRESTIVTGNLNNADDGGPRGWFCGRWDPKECEYTIETDKGGGGGGGGGGISPSPQEPATPATYTSCSGTVFSLVIDVKNATDVFVAFGQTATGYEGGFDIPYRVSGEMIPFYMGEYQDALPNPVSLGSALGAMYGGAKIRLPDWASNHYITNNNGFWKWEGTTDRPLTADEMRSGKWLVYNGTASTSCGNLLTYNATKIGFDAEQFVNPSNKDEGYIVQPSGHNGRKLDGGRASHGFNFSHLLPPSTKTRYLYSHLPVSLTYGLTLHTAFAEDYADGAEMDEDKARVALLYYSGDTFFDDWGFFNPRFNRSGFEYNKIIGARDQGYRDNAYGNIYENRNYAQYFASLESYEMPFTRIDSPENTDIIHILIKVPPRAYASEIFMSASTKAV